MPRLKICLSPKLPNAPLVPESANLLVTVGSGAGAAGAAFEPRINSFQGDFEGASTSPGALSSPAKCALFCPSYRSDRRSIESNGGLVSIGSSGFWFCNCVVSNCRNVLKLLAIIVESTAVPLELVEVLAAVPLVDGVEVADLCPPPKTGSVCLLASAAEHPLGRDRQNLGRIRDVLGIRSGLIGPNGRCASTGTGTAMSDVAGAFAFVAGRTNAGLTTRQLRAGHTSGLILLLSLQAPG